MARYRKLDLRTWNDKKFRELSPLPCSGQSVWLVLVLGPQTTNIPGLFEASEITIADRFGWSVEDFRKAFAEASSKGMAKADWTARLVWLPKAPEYNKPESPNVVVSWGSVFDELPECPLKRQAYQTLKAFAKGWGQSYSEAFDKSFREPSLKAMPNQEQEQEQEQKQEQCVRGAAGETPRAPELGEAEHHQHFERLQAKYPDYTGRQNWIATELACRRLIETGEGTWDDFEAGVNRLAAYVEAGGYSSPKYVPTPLNFFTGADKPWLQPWTPPPTKEEQRVAKNIDETEQWLRERRGANAT